jgi:hypothetical protein
MPQPVQSTVYQTHIGRIPDAYEKRDQNPEVPSGFGLFVVIKCGFALN